MFIIPAVMMLYAKHDIFFNAKWLIEYGWRTGSKLFPEPMMTYCQLDPQKYYSMKFDKEIFSFNKMHFQMPSAKWRPVCSFLNMLTKCL